MAYIFSFLTLINVSNSISKRKRQKYSLTLFGIFIRINKCEIHLEHSFDSKLVMNKLTSKIPLFQDNKSSNISEIIYFSFLPKHCT